MMLLGWLIAGTLAFTLASLLALWSYGRFARRARGHPSKAIPPGRDAPLDRMTRTPEHAAEAAALPPPGTADTDGMTGLALVDDGHNAFRLRVLTAREARRSLDILTYIWRDDITGRLLALELLEAADRGVRVRLLLDDAQALGFDRKYLGLNAHRNIEVRLFNPIRARRTFLGRGLEILLSLVRFNRRLHCKAWIADGRVAISGGRNVSDNDFALVRPQSRPGRDMDLLIAGAAVREAADLFDAHWNGGLALPISAFWSGWMGDQRYRERLHDTRQRDAARSIMAPLSPRNGGTAPPLVRDGGPGLEQAIAALRWSSGARLIADPPEKALGLKREAWMPRSLRALMLSARSELQIVTPYFVPGDDGAADLMRLARSGVRVEVLTNALNSTNHGVVHGAYRYYRAQLLAAGVVLREFAPPKPELSKPEMLHAKAMMIDHRVGFVGSFNFDLRSAFLNAEMGMVFDDPHLLADLAQSLATLADPDISWQLALDRGRIVWRRGTRTVTHDPDALALRRGLSWVVGHLPIHSHL